MFNHGDMHIAWQLLLQKMIIFTLLNTSLIYVMYDSRIIFLCRNNNEHILKYTYVKNIRGYVQRSILSRWLSREFGLWTGRHLHLWGTICRAPRQTCPCSCSPGTCHIRGDHPGVRPRDNRAYMSVSG